jgi:3-hydroxyacyl-[acyl-carrier-protein] dehydratase
MMEFEEIKKVLKQRFPVIMVDRVLDMIPGNSVKAIKNVTGNEMFFMGHFPQYAIMPGVMIVEALAQTASIMISSIENDENKKDEFVVLGVINEMRFKEPVYPGYTLVLKINMVKAIDNYFIVAAEAEVDDRVVAKGKLTLVKTGLKEK